jgi:hypothetical protein
VDLDPDPNWGSGSRKAKKTHKKKKKVKKFSFRTFFEISAHLGLHNGFLFLQNLLLLL